jgi:hypothetical protein
MGSADNLVKIAAFALLLAHIVVVLWLRRRIGWVIALNLLVSAGVIAYWLPDISELPGYVPLVWVFVGFEVLVFATSVAAAFGMAMPRAVIWTEFAAHAALTCAALIFIVTFKITRLI